MNEVKIESLIFEDLREMINGQMRHILQNLTEESFVDGEINIKLNIEAKKEYDINDEKIIKPTFRYKVSSNLKRAWSENDAIKFNDRILQRHGQDYYLMDYSGDQTNMMEEEYE